MGCESKHKLDRKICVQCWEEKFSTFLGEMIAEMDPSVAFLNCANWVSIAQSDDQAETKLVWWGRSEDPWGTQFICSGDEPVHSPCPLLGAALRCCSQGTWKTQVTMLLDPLLAPCAWACPYHNLSTYCGNLVGETVTTAEYEEVALLLTSDPLAYKGSGRQQPRGSKPGISQTMDGEFGD